MAQAKSESLERIYLNDLRKRRMSVAVYLVSGVIMPTSSTVPMLIVRPLNAQSAAGTSQLALR